MSNQIRIRVGKSTGRAHIQSNRNRQDSMKTGTLQVRDKVFYYGFVCDGCSEGLSSEIGAGLAAEYLGRQTEMLLKQRVQITKIPTILHKRTVGFLKEILGKISFDSPRSRVEYIKNNLLFTVLGYIFTDSDEESIIFYQGDGVFVVNDTTTVLDENDYPHYIGYSLVDRKYIDPSATALPTDFEVLAFSGSQISKLAIASDALKEEPDFIANELWGYENPMGLQRRVNVWSLNNHKFQDDLSVITLEKIPVAITEDKP